MRSVRAAGCSAGLQAGCFVQEEGTQTANQCLVLLVMLRLHIQNNVLKDKLRKK